MSETKKHYLTVQDMVLVAVFTALISVCSWITIPAAAGQGLPLCGKTGRLLNCTKSGKQETHMHCM